MTTTFDKINQTLDADMNEKKENWNHPVQLSSVNPQYDQGFADGCSESKRLNEVDAPVPPAGDTAERGALKADLERLRSASLIESKHLDRMIEHSDHLQSELTKARELLSEVVNSMGSTEGRRTARSKVREYLAHQPAPAAKGEGDE